MAREGDLRARVVAAAFHRQHLAFAELVVKHLAADGDAVRRLEGVEGIGVVRFNAADGSGYAFLADRILDLHDKNPQVASRLARSFDRWQKFAAGRQAHARAALERIRDHAGLSRDVLEVVSRALGA